MRQLEDKLSANVNPSGHISVLLELKVSCMLATHPLFSQMLVILQGTVWGEGVLLFIVFFPW